MVYDGTWPSARTNRAEKQHSTDVAFARASHPVAPGSNPALTILFSLLLSLWT